VYQNGHIFVEVAHTNVSPQIPSFKSNCNQRRLSWTVWVGGIWPALAPIRSAISTPVLTPGDIPTSSVSHRLPARYWLKSTAKMAWRRTNIHT